MAGAYFFSRRGSNSKTVRGLIKVSILAVFIIFENFLAGYLIVSFWFDYQAPYWKRTLLKISLGAGLGVGLSSIWFFLSLAVLRLNFGCAAALQSALLVALFALTALKRKRSSIINQLSTASDKTNTNIAAVELNEAKKSTEEGLVKIARAKPGTNFNILLYSGLAVLVIGNLVAFAYQCSIRPHGDFDAMMDWTLKARFLYALDFDLRRSLPVELFWSHPEYPLLLPISICEIWCATRNTEQLAPHIVAAIFTASTAILFWSALSTIKNSQQASLASLFLLSTPFFVLSGSMLIADAPIGFFFLAATTCTFLQCTEKKRYPFLPIEILAGLSAGLAVWTKREGIIFLLSYSAAIVITNIKAPQKCIRELLLFLLGALPGLFCLLLLKDIWPAYSPLMSSFDWKPFLEPHTYLTVLKLDFLQFFSFGRWQLSPIPILLLYFIIYRSHPRLAIKRTSQKFLLTFILMNLSYFIYFINFGAGAAFEVACTANRLLIQLWPSMLLTLFINCQSPSEILALKPKSASTNTSIGYRTHCG
jgi:hypothetical protein